MPLAQQACGLGRLGLGLFQCGQQIALSASGPVVAVFENLPAGVDVEIKL